MEWGLAILWGIAICAFFILLSDLLPESWIGSLDRAGILLGYLVTSFSLAFVFYAFYKRTEIRQWFQRSKYLNTGEDFEIKEEEFEGVVIPVSRGEQPEWIISHLKPKFVAFIYTERSRKDAGDITENFKDHCKSLISREDIDRGIDRLDNPDDPFKAKELTRKHIQDLRLKGLKHQRYLLILQVV